MSKEGETRRPPLDLSALSIRTVQEGLQELAAQRETAAPEEANKVSVRDFLEKKEEEYTRTPKSGRNAILVRMILTGLDNEEITEDQVLALVKDEEVQKKEGGIRAVFSRLLGKH